MYICKGELKYSICKTYEPAHNKTYNNTCVAGENLDQPVHPLSAARDLVFPSLNNPGAVEGTCDQRKL